MNYLKIMMSNNTKDKLKQLYEIDDYLWLQETINLLKTKNLETLDLEHLIEELENLGKRDLNKARSLLRQIIIHLLFLQYWPEEYQRNYRHWQGEVTVFRVDLNNHLTTTLENKLNQELESIYQTALKIVLQKTGLPVANFPKTCPYSLQKLLDEDWHPEE
jgi:hypothetical protein